MSVNSAGFIALGLALAFFVAIYRYALALPWRRRLFLLLIFSVISIPSLLVSIYYLHILPEKEWFYAMRAFPGSEFLVIFLGCAAGCLAAFLPRVLLALPLFALMLLGVAPYLKPVLGPLNPELLEDRWQGRACLQSTSSTCGPASVCSLLAAAGIPATEREAVQAAHSYVGGTEAWYLARFVRRKGLVAAFRFRDSFTPSVGLPAMVGVNMGGAGHFIAVLEVKDGGVTFVDPLGGEEHLPMAEFMKRYRFSGFHMTVMKS